MKMRTTHVTGVPLRQDDVEPRLRRVSIQDRTGIAGRGVLLPRNLVRQLEDDGVRVEVRRGGYGQKHHQCSDGNSHGRSSRVLWRWTGADKRKLAASLTQYDGVI